MEKLHSPKFWADKMNTTPTKVITLMQEGKIPKAQQDKNGDWVAPFTFIGPKMQGPKFWSKMNGYSPSTNKRWMIDGTIPNAEKTKGGHWRAPYTFFAMLDASIAAGSLTLEQDGDEMVWSSNTRPSSELLKCFDGVFDVHSPVNKRGSLHYRLAMALSRGIDCLPVTLDELDYCDGKFREIIASENQQAALSEAKQCAVFTAWVPEDEHFTECKNEVEDGRNNYITLVVAYVLTFRGVAAGESKDYLGLLLHNWCILKGKKIADESNQEWRVDEDGVFRPRLSWVESSRSSFYRACPEATRREASLRAANLVGVEPPPLREPKQRKPTRVVYK